MKNESKILITLNVIFIGMIVFIVYARSSIKVGVREELQQEVMKIKKFDKIDVIVDHVLPMPSPPADNVALADAENSSTLAVLKSIGNELSMYPKAIVNKYFYKTITIGKSLVVNLQQLNGFADYERRVLFVDVAVLTCGFKDARRIIHHEIFHMIDSAAPGLLPDDVWSSLNSNIFKYGQKISELPKGFISVYSTTHPGEDKAELYSMMVVHPHYVWAKCGDDAVLAKKYYMVLDRLCAIGINQIL